VATKKIKIALDYRYSFDLYKNVSRHIGIQNITSKHQQKKRIHLALQIKLMDTPLSTISRTKALKKILLVSFSVFFLKITNKNKFPS
jgi:hypothetical protein